MRTKVCLSLFLLVLVAVLQFVPLHGIPGGDQIFAKRLFIAFGAFFILIVMFAKVFYCPKCGADTGRFVGRLDGRVSKTKSFRCKKCGSVTDQWGNPLD